MKTFLTLLLAAVCVVGYAQKKPKINQALSAMEDGNLAEAKSIIDAAIEHEKTKDDPKTWYYRGQIYATLDTVNQEPGALEEAIRSFDKTLELDPEQKSVNTFNPSTGQVENVDSKRLGYYAFYYNEAIADYNEKDFEGATNNFETAYLLNPSDTNTVLNAAYSAAAAGDVERAKKNYNESYKAGARDKTIFLQLYNYALKEENFEEGLEVIRKGKQTYPKDMDFTKYEINLLIQMDKTEAARDELEVAIEKDPQNADLYFTLGVLKEELGEKESAMESYQKAIEIDPNHYNSNFNIGVATFNEANELIKQRNSLGYKEQKKYDALSKQINSQLEKTLPVWEKLYSINSSDQTVLETLSYIYTALKMNDKAEKMQDELDALSGN